MRTFNRNEVLYMNLHHVRFRTSQNIQVSLLRYSLYMMAWPSKPFVTLYSLIQHKYIPEKIPYEKVNTKNVATRLNGSRSTNIFYSNKLNISIDL